MWGGFDSSARDVSVHSAEALRARSAARLRRRATRAGITAGAVAVAMLFASVPSITQASERPDDRSKPGTWTEPIAPVTESETSKPEPLDGTPPPHPTPKPKPKPKPTPPPHPTPKPKPNPKPKPTARAQTPSNPATGEQVPGKPGQGRQSPGDPNPVRSDEPPAAPGNPMPGSAGGQPPVEPGTTYVDVDPPGPGATAPTGAGAPLPHGLGPPASRVQLVVAAATVSGIAAVAGWLVVGGRRRERVPLHRPWATTVTLADEVKLDFELVRRGPERSPDARYAGRVPPAATPTLWRSEDDRPRWLRRLNDQVPPRSPAAGPSRGPDDDDDMPWLAAVAWPHPDDHDEDPLAR